MKKYIVKLAKEERAYLSKLIAQGQASARKLLHARIVLKADSSEDGPGWTDQAISEALEVGIATVERVRRRLVEEGVAAALTRHRPHTPRLRKLDGEQEAQLIALVCRQPEEGQERWTLQLLAEKLVQLHSVESISQETIRQVLAHNELKPWLKSQWCIPPKRNAEFVCQMEEVLTVYTRPYDERLCWLLSTSVQKNRDMCQEHHEAQPSCTGSMSHLLKREDLISSEPSCFAASLGRKAKP